MKIIDLGICIDNNDPQHLGRIRYKLFSETGGQRERALDYKPWDDNDLFVASPFLPNNINFIPEVGQPVKIMGYNYQKDTVNQVYIAGPFSTMFDYNSQTFSQGIENTSYGASVKHKKDIIDKDGKYKDARAVGAFAKHNHFGIYGKYGSDVIFTDDGIQIRGGKLVSKKSASPRVREQLLSTPIMSKKVSKLHLKKYPQKMVLKTTETPITTVESRQLNHIVEYTIDDLNNPTNVTFYVYKILKSYGDLYNTNSFTNNTDIVPENLKLITGISSNYTYSINVTDIRSAYSETRGFLSTIHTSSLNGVDVLFKNEDLHPFYFRPTKELKERGGNVSNKTLYISNVSLRRVGQNSGHGLIWSSVEPTPPTKTTTEKKTITTLENNSQEQTFGSIVSDKIFLLSTDTNEAGKSINFDGLDKYEYTQEDYISKIEPNTYSLVRGENLLNLLYAIIDVLTTHRHNINDPYARTDYPQHNRLIELFEKMENDLLNRSIRLN